MKRKPLVVWIKLSFGNILFSAYHAHSSQGAARHCNQCSGTPTKFIEAPKPREKKPKPEIVYGKRKSGLARKRAT